MAVTTLVRRQGLDDRRAHGRRAPSLHTTVKLPRASSPRRSTRCPSSRLCKAVVVDGKRYTRKDFEDETPIILVESPLPVRCTSTSPLHATGTANTFEATFQYDLRDPAASS